MGAISMFSWGYSSPLPSAQVRRSCPYQQASGCILDQMEKVCEGGNSKMMAHNAIENVWMCCCPKPYSSCKENEVDKQCVKSIKESAGKNEGLLALRSTLLNGSAQCSDFVHRGATKAMCGEWPKKYPELMCEMLTWQLEELGDGNKPEFDKYKCPFKTADRAKKADARKNNALKFDPRKLDL